MTEPIAGAAMEWWQRRMAALDLETTAPNPEEARIVQACLAHVGGGQEAEVKTWLVNCAVEIPAEATAIHGITTERVRAEGDEPKDVVQEIVDLLVAAALREQPIVIMNAPYDLTVVAREAERNGVEMPVFRGLIVDPLVLDKYVDKYRKGSRKLVDMCAHYGCRIDGAHGAAFDALAAARVAYRLAQSYRHVGGASLLELQQLQERAYFEQATGLNEYWIRKGDTRRVDSFEWPIRTRRQAA